MPLNAQAPPTTEAEVFLTMFDYIDRLFSIVRPRKLLVMAIGASPFHSCFQGTGFGVFQANAAFLSLFDSSSLPCNIMACRLQTA